LCEQLGGLGPDGKPIIGQDYASKLKLAAGMVKRSRWFDVDAVLAWKQEHPSWAPGPRRAASKKKGQR